MKHLKVKAFVAIAIVLTTLIWIILLFLLDLHLEATWVAFKQLPSVLSIEMLFWAFFVKRGWRLKVFQDWLVPFPFIQGTWRGALTSTWINPGTQQPVAPIAVLLVIRQTFLSIHCTLLTQDSKSQSFSASIHIDSDTDEKKKLVYSYTNKPDALVRENSPIHEGTAALLIIGSPPTKLRGEYWTNRKTIGEINLQFESKSLAEQFL